MLQRTLSPAAGPVPRLCLHNHLRLFSSASASRADAPAAPGTGGRGRGSTGAKTLTIGGRTISLANSGATTAQPSFFRGRGPPPVRGRGQNGNGSGSGRSAAFPGRGRGQQAGAGSYELASGGRADGLSGRLAARRALATPQVAPTPGAANAPAAQDPEAFADPDEGDASQYIPLRFAAKDSPATARSLGSDHNPPVKLASPKAAGKSPLDIGFEFADFESLSSLDRSVGPPASTTFGSTRGKRGVSGARGAPHGAFRGRAGTAGPRVNARGGLRGGRGGLRAGGASSRGRETTSGGVLGLGRGRGAGGGGRRRGADRSGGPQVYTEASLGKDPLRYGYSAPSPQHFHLPPSASAGSVWVSSLRGEEVAASDYSARESQLRTAASEGLPGSAPALPGPLGAAQVPTAEHAGAPPWRLPVSGAGQANSEEIVARAVGLLARNPGLDGEQGLQAGVAAVKVVAWATADREQRNTWIRAASEDRSEEANA